MWSEVTQRSRGCRERESWGHHLNTWIQPHLKPSLHPEFWFCGLLWARHRSQRTTQIPPCWQTPCGLTCLLAGEGKNNDVIKGPGVVRVRRVERQVPGCRLPQVDQEG